MPVDEKRARLPERHELKYFINQGDMIALGHRLGGAMRGDPHADANGEYHIRSLYFDDAYDRAYWDKLDGVRDRDKYRIRIYNLSDRTIFLERKRKVGDLIQKSSVRISRNLCDQLLRGEAAGLERTGAPLLMDLFAEMRTKWLQPSVIVDYRREVFIHPAENVRITFDKNVRTGRFDCNLFDEHVFTVSPLDDKRQILEVKFDRYLPDYIAHLLRGVPVERSAISKYTLCRRFGR